MRAALGLAVAALALTPAPASAAELSIVPSSVERGAAVDLDFSIPNDHDARGIDHVTLGIPSDFRLDDAEAKPGWEQSRTGQAITWSGGRIPKHQFGRFAIRGTAPKMAETVLFNVVVGDRAGRSTTYRVGLSVTAHGYEDGGARAVGRAALIVAIAAAALALTGVLLAAYRRLKTSGG